MVTQLEKIDKYLNHPNIENLKSKALDDELFGRVREFTVFDEKYTLVWYKNAINLYIGYNGAMLAADTVVRNGFWPNRSHLNLVFKLNKQTCFVIPLEPY